MFVCSIYSWGAQELNFRASGGNSFRLLICCRHPVWAMYPCMWGERLLQYFVFVLPVGAESVFVVFLPHVRRGSTKGWDVDDKAIDSSQATSQRSLQAKRSIKVWAEMKRAALLCSRIKLSTARQNQDKNLPFSAGPAVWVFKWKCRYTM